MKKKGKIKIRNPNIFSSLESTGKFLATGTMMGRTVKPRKSYSPFNTWRESVSGAVNFKQSPYGEFLGYSSFGMKPRKYRKYNERKPKEKKTIRKVVYYNKPKQDEN